MQKISLPQKVENLLKANPNEKFTARQIAEQITKIYAEDYKEKRANPRFENDNAFIQQIVAEIGTHKKPILKKNLHIFCMDKPRPRLFWYDPDNINNDISFMESEIVENSDKPVFVSKDKVTEHDLYPLLIDYLKNELDLFCQRIDEKRSKNSYRGGGNQWLHPDIVAIKPIDKDWNNLIRTCVKHGAGQRVSFMSFEVKKELNGSNLRKSFFQAVSNSSWANEGYLVAPSITNNIEQELRMLSALHGIGVIILNPEDPSESEIFLPAKAKANVDWQSVDRITKENEDFKDFIELVSTYYQTGRIRQRDWNKVKR
ncbi:MAG: HrgA protein [Deltaproteobacteria bacterium]|nr:HrgA protein [Deltaproteobacteria bacterium]